MWRCYEWWGNGGAMSDRETMLVVGKREMKRERERERKKEKEKEREMIGEGMIIGNDLDSDAISSHHDE